MTTADTKATLSFSDGSPSVEFPIYKGTVGPEVNEVLALMRRPAAKVLQKGNFK